MICTPDSREISCIRGISRCKSHGVASRIVEIPCSLAACSRICPRRASARLSSTRKSRSKRLQKICSCINTPPSCCGEIVPSTVLTCFMRVILHFGCAVPWFPRLSARTRPSPANRAGPAANTAPFPQRQPLFVRRKGRPPTALHAWRALLFWGAIFRIEPQSPLQPRVRPPSMAMFWPMMKLASGVSRYSANSATSSHVPGRPTKFG